MPEPTIPELIARCRETSIRVTSRPSLVSFDSIELARGFDRIADEVERLTAKLASAELQIAALEESLAAKMQEVADTGRELEARR